MRLVVAEIPVVDIPLDARVDRAAFHRTVEFGPDEHIALLANAAKPAELAPAVPDDQQAGKRHQRHNDLEQGRLGLEVVLPRKGDDQYRREDGPDDTEAKRVHVVPTRLAARAVHHKKVSAG